MPSFGEKLKVEREKRTITLEQISSSTKIGIRMLQALEEDNFDQLPGGIFNKGFVRAYARHVGLDEDQTIADYLEASGQNTPPKPVPVIEPPPADDPRETTPPWRNPWGWLAAGLLVIALLLSLWSRSHREKDRPAPSPAPASSSNPAPDSVDAASAPPLVASAAAIPGSPAPAATNSVPTSVPAGAFTVVILAREDCWLSITADGKAIFENILVAENQQAIHAQKEVVVKAGNTGGIDFVLNGKKLPSQGDYGEVKTLTFGSGGLQPNAPVAPTTP